MPPSAGIVGRRGLLSACAAMCLLASAGCGVPGPDGPADSYGLDFSLPAGSTNRGAIVFIVDGLDAEVFDEMLRAGELPAIRKYFVDRGLHVPRAVANVPSVTLANLTTLVTGRFPGHHGVTGVNWFDRNQLLWRNYESIAQKNTLDSDYTAPTVYEQFPRETTISVFLQPHRGATKFVENWTSAGPPFFFGWYEFVDRLTLHRFGVVMDIARKRRAISALTAVYLLAPDFFAYKYGASSPQYRQAIRHTDRQIGRVLGDLERAGLLDKIVLALVSDHGHLDVSRHFPLEAHLRDAVGLNVARKRLWEEAPFEKRQDYYLGFNCVLYGSGDRYWAIQLRRPARSAGGEVSYEPWPARPSAEELRAYPVVREPPWWRRGQAPSVSTVDLPAELASREAVDAVAYAAGPDAVRVRTRLGEVEFRQPAGARGEITYRLVAGDDPLGWKGKVPSNLLAGAPAAGRRWLEATAGTQYPDLPEQIVAYFRARRAGDIAVFAAPGWDFNTINRAGHGGLCPGDMRVPMLLAGPGVPRARLDVARTTDLVPTLLHLLGKPAPRGLDGRSLVPAGAPPTTEASR